MRLEIGEDLLGAVGLSVQLGLEPVAQRVLVVSQVVRERLFLLGELRRVEPEELMKLHLRAADWYESRGSPATALEHLLNTTERDRCVRLVTELILPTYAAGQMSTVQRFSPAARRLSDRASGGRRSRMTAMSPTAGEPRATLGQPGKTYRSPHSPVGRRAQPNPTKFVSMSGVEIGRWASLVITVPVIPCR